MLLSVSALSVLRTSNGKGVRVGTSFGSIANAVEFGAGWIGGSTISDA